MRIIWLLGPALAGALFWGCDRAAPPQNVDAYAPMAAFSSLAGKSWRGEGAGPDGRPIVDVATYEMILDGRALQSTHRLEDGAYGGRTVIFYDEGAKRHIFHYFTTAGFHTTGEIIPTEYGFRAVEQVQGHPEFVEVHSEFFIEGDILRVQSRHVDKAGKRSDGDEIVYRQIPDPGPLFGDDE